MILFATPVGSRDRAMLAAAAWGQVDPKLSAGTRDEFGAGPTFRPYLKGSLVVVAPILRFNHWRDR